MTALIMSILYFAGGCFWGTEHFMQQIDGVVDTEVGYANSRVADPTYRQVCNGTTGAAETVKVTYDPQKVSAEFLTRLFFMTIDPTSVNRQGNDRGTQYRTGIYYTSADQLPGIERVMAEQAAEHSAPLAVELQPIGNFYPAEDYHQRYLDKNPGGYCHIDPRLFEMARRAHRSAYSKPTEEQLRARLTPLQYEVTRNSATEPPFNNEYWDNKEAGIYVDITTGEPLFLSTDKFDSGCGWPSFAKPISDEAVKEQTDRSHGMTRTEVRSNVGDAHLGHVFPDGPKALGGLRYCINSAALRFIPRSRMKAEGYGDYLRLLPPDKAAPTAREPE